MDIYELKKAHEKHCPNSHFFDRETLKFFGQSLSKMNVLKYTYKHKEADGTPHLCYCVSALGKDWNGTPRRSYYYFDVNNFEYII